MSKVENLFFIRKFIGSRDAIRLAETSCGWMIDVIGKTAVDIFQTVVHVDQLEAFFYEVDRAIDLALPFTGLGEIEREYRLLQKSDSAYRITSMVVAVLRFCSDTAAALECLGLIGVVVLSPSIEGLAFAAGAIGVCANLGDLFQKVYDNYLMVYEPRDYEALKLVEFPEEPGLNIDWSQNLCAIASNICDISTDFFKGLEFIYGPGGITPPVYRFWRTSAAFSSALQAYIGSKG